jgi:hypothetical protein
MHRMNAIIQRLDRIIDTETRLLSKAVQSGSAETAELTRKFTEWKNKVDSGDRSYKISDTHSLIGFRGEIIQGRYFSVTFRNIASGKTVSFEFILHDTGYVLSAGGGWGDKITSVTHLFREINKQI